MHGVHCWAGVEPELQLHSGGWGGRGGGRGVGGGELGRWEGVIGNETLQEVSDGSIHTAGLCWKK